MKFFFQHLNKKIARQLYFNYFIKSFIQPFFISIIYLLCALIVSKYFFKEMPLWFWLVLIIPVVLIFAYYFYKSSKIFFSDQELWAFIDFKTSSAGMYLTANELRMPMEEKIKLQMLNKSFTNLPLTIPWRVIINYLAIFTLFLLIMIYLPPTFINLNTNTGELLAVEKSQLEDLINAKVIDPKLAEEFQKELEGLKEDFKNNGINKENWEKKQAISQMLDDKFTEQQKVQEKILAQMETLEKKINESEKLEDLAKQMHAIESSLAQNEYAKQSEEFQKAEDELSLALSEGKGSPSDKNLGLNEKLKALKAMKSLSKEMQMQLNARNGYEPSPNQQTGNVKKGEKNLADSLSALAKRLEQESDDSEADFQIESQGPGRGGVSRGKGDAELKYNNNTDPSLMSPLNLEEFNQGGQFNKEGQVVDVTKGEHDKYTVDNQKNEERNFKNTGTDLVNDQRVVPNRREVIKKYFKREATQEK